MPIAIRGPALHHITNLNLNLTLCDRSEPSPAVRTTTYETSQLPPRIFSHTSSMLSRRIAAARPLTRALLPAAARPLSHPQFTQRRTALTQSELLDVVDPNMVRPSYSLPLDPDC